MEDVEPDEGWEPDREPELAPDAEADGEEALRNGRRWVDREVEGPAFSADCGCDSDLAVEPAEVEPAKPEAVLPAEPGLEEVLRAVFLEDFFLEADLRVFLEIAMHKLRGVSRCTWECSV